jgi:hypothetical protein
VEPQESWEKLDLFKVIEAEESLMSTRMEKTGDTSD